MIDAAVKRTSSRLSAVRTSSVKTGSSVKQKLFGKKSAAVADAPAPEPEEEEELVPYKPYMVGAQPPCCNKKCCCFACGITALAVVVLAAFVYFFGPTLLPYAPLINGNRTASSSYTPIVLYCERTVDDPAAYGEAWTAFTEFTQAGTPGVRAMVSFMSHEDANKALQFFWFDSVDTFFGQAKNKALSDALWATYTGTKESDFCKVFGGWTEKLKEVAATIPGVHYSFVKPFGGWLRSPPASGFQFDGPVMFWITKREIKEGHMEAYKKGFKRVADMMYGVAPALLGPLEFQDDQDPKYIWSIRIFTDFFWGTLAHAYFSPFIFPSIASMMLPHYGSMIYPVANSFSSKAMIDFTCSVLPQNLVYEQYVYDKDRLGPVPDFKK